MRLHTFVLTATVGALGLGSGQIRPLLGASLHLIQFSSPWKYYAGSAGLPTNWAQTDFNDAAWPSGPGALGTPVDEDLLGLATMQTPLPLTGSNDVPIIGYYFRTQFDFPSNTLGVTLTASTLIDDGAVIYLNGVEAGRIRMPAGTVTTNTLASYTEVGTNGVGVISLAVTNLVQGENLLAVEVHQSSTTSGDAVFALSLAAMVPEPLVIIEQPASQTVPVQRSVSPSSFYLSVGVTGTSPSFQWFKDGAAVSGGNSHTLTVTPRLITDSADYFVVVTNALGSVTSAVARLTVVEDTFPPTLVRAYQEPVTNNLLRVIFSENIRSASATNPANYQLRLDGSGQDLAVIKAQPFLAVVALTVPPLQAEGRYILTVNNLQDVYSNTIAPNTRAVIGSWREVVPLDAAWRFHAQGWDLGTGWTNPEYDDSSWPEGRALLYAEQGYLPPCAGEKNTPLIFGYPTYYFRTRFQLEETTGRGMLAFRHAVDDGAVFYLNGMAIHAYNMVPGPLSYTSRAGVPLDASCVSSTNVNVLNLVAGENVLAVEVHQATNPDNDVVFGASVELIHQPLVPPILECARQPDGQIRLWWTEAEAVLEAAEQFGGPWSDVADTSPVLVAPEGPARFFRLRRP